MSSVQRPAQGHRLERLSIPETIRDSLRERILSGEFEEGGALVQDVIAAEYGVSRMPVREALRQLEAAGLVAMRTHRGATVTTIPTEQVQELFELRALLEGDVLAHALPRITDRALDAAAATLEALRDAYRLEETASWGRLNWTFHRQLYEAGDRNQTMAILEGINLKTERLVRVHLVVTGRIAAAERDHAELLRLCRMRDAAAAVPFLRDHILEAGSTLVAALRRHRTG